MSFCCRIIQVIVAGLALVAGLASAKDWVGGSGNDWHDPANWSPAGVPTNGDAVVIDASSTATSVLLYAATPWLDSVTISNRLLVCSNWTTALKASQVTVKSGGKIALPAAFTNDQVSNRVWIVCSNLLVETNGTIDARGRGFAGGQYNGNGPGGGIYHGNRGSGAGHGGRGGDSSYSTAIQTGGVPCGVASAPDLPGSGGGSYGNVSYRGGAGGGAVRIEATNCTLNGSIQASGNQADYNSGGGAGGSIWITCLNLAGTNGALSVRGGNTYGAGDGGGAGAGGRIAMEYAAASDPLALVYDASPGSNGLWSGWFRRTTPVMLDPAEMGTLTLGRTNGWLGETMAGLFQNVRLAVPGFTAWSPASLALTNCRVRLEDGFNLQVSGGVTLGTNSALAIFSNGVFNCNGDVAFSGGELVLETPAQVVCGGGMSLQQGGKFHVVSPPTNGTSAYGVAVTISNDLTTAGSSWIYPYSQSSNGGSVLFTAKNILIETNSGISADTLGLGWRRTGGGNGAGPGGGFYHPNRGSGAGYGGQGGWSYYSSWNVSGGLVYASASLPLMPGSSGGMVDSGRPAGSGGGLVWLDVASNATVRGRLSANGGQAGYNAGAGSGGAIFLLCDALAGTTNGLLAAEGGAGYNAGDGGGAGGGGRIAVGIGMSRGERDDLMAGSPVARLVAYTNHSPAPIRLSVITNAHAVNYTGQEWRGPEVGTFTFQTTRRIMTVEGDPGRYGLPATDGYGTTPAYADDAVITNTVVSPADENNGLRRACIGWSLANLSGDPISNNVNTQAVAILTTNIVLTWHWTNEYLLTVSCGSGGGVNTNMNGWYTNGNTVTGITATAAVGYVFAEWTGDVPDGHATDNPLSVDMTNARSIIGHFASLTGLVKTWSGTNVWESATNWTPSGMPCSNDTAHVPTGTVLFGFSHKVANIIVGTNATFVFTNWNTVITVTNQVTVLSNGLITLPLAFATNQMSNSIGIVALTLNVSTGGVISAARGGYVGTNNSGYGPGRGIYGARCSGGGHGGRGGDATDTTTTLYPGGSTNDDTAAPHMPGSSGGGYDLTRVGGAGGGVMRLEATNLNISGTITANGADGGSWCGGGAGGSIWVSCQNLAGNGTMVARGGNSGGSGAGGGGGGRIAVEYSAMAPGAAPRFDATPGTGYVTGWVRSTAPPYTDVAEMGTLYLSRTNGWLAEDLTNIFQAVQLVTPGFSSWNPSRLLVRDCRLALERGFQLQVNNDLQVMTNGLLFVRNVPQLSCGGTLTVSNGEIVVDAVTQVVVGADLVVTNNGRGHFLSGPTNSDCGTGMVVVVSNAIRTGLNGWIYPYSEPTNGGSILFTVKDVQIATNSGFNADSRGFRGGVGYEDGYGPGRGLKQGNRGSGGGYGGVGGYGLWGSYQGPGGTNYGATNAPVYAGSGGGGVSSRAGGGRGGGLIRIEASGSFTLDGALQANGGPSAYDCGAGSGGGIYLVCQSFRGSATATLAASGGNGYNIAQCGAGGGGRIAVWYGCTPGMVAQALQGAGAAMATNYAEYYGQIAFSNGVGPTLPPNVYAAYPGTCYFLNIAGQPGTVFIFH